MNSTKRNANGERMKLHDDYHNRAEDIYPNEAIAYVKQLFIEAERHMEASLRAFSKVRHDHLDIIARSIKDRVQAEDPDELVSQFWYAQCRNHTKDTMVIFDEIESVAKALPQNKGD